MSAVYLAAQDSRAIPTPAALQAVSHTAVPGSKIPNRRIVVLKRSHAQTQMTIEQQRLACDTRIMTVNLEQISARGRAVLTVEFTEVGGAGLSVRGKISEGSALTKYFQGSPAPYKLTARSPLRARAWVLIDAFIEEGPQFVLALLARHAQTVDLQGGLLAADPAGLPLVCRPACLRRLANGTLVRLFNESGKLSINISHAEYGWGDQLIYTVPREIADELPLSVLQHFYEEICTDDAEHQRTALLGLHQIMAIGNGQVELVPGTRQALAQALYRKLHPALGKRLDFWCKGPALNTEAHAQAMLCHGLEYETLRRKDAEFDVFTEIELGLAPRPDSEHSYFVVKNPFGLELRFKIPSETSLLTWQQRVESMLRCFVSRPERLWERYAAWLDRGFTSLFPINRDALAAYRQLLKLHKAEAAARAAVPESRHKALTDLRCKNDIFELTFTLENGTKVSQRNTLTFRVNKHGLALIVLTRFTWPMPRRKIFMVNASMPSYSRLLKLFSQFYADQNHAGSFQEMCVYRYLSQCYGQAEPPGQKLTHRLHEVFLRRAS